jgi:integrase
MSSAFSDSFIRNIKTAGRYTDAAIQGLNLQVKANGGKYWALRYLFQDKRYDLSLGSYPNVSLKEARIRATAARAQLNAGQRPEPTWKPHPPNKEQQQTKVPSKATFSQYAADCIASKRAEWKNAKHAEQWSSTVEMYANPLIGGKPIDAVDMEDILNILTPIWTTKTVTATRLRGRLEWILASATTRGLRTGVNPASWKGLLETVLPKPGKIAKEQHHPALDYRLVHGFIRQLQEANGVAGLALEFLVLNANRTGEVTGGRREEVSENGIWTIPGERMKVGKEHRVPLGQRSLELLEIAKSLDPDSDYLFSRKGKPLSNMAMSMLLRRLGYSVTVHGFRSTFRDWVAEETSHSPEVAEKALAHSIANKVESAYRRGDLLEPRRRLMADWECYCLTGQLACCAKPEERRAA